MAGLGAHSSSQMSFDIEEDDGDTLIVHVSGELDITNVDALASAVATALERRPPRLVVDVTELRFADSSAIALWVQWARAVPEIELRRVSPLLRRVLGSMGLLETLNVTR
jgi:anti-sigma B factor antagonist